MTSSTAKKKPSSGAGMVNSSNIGLWLVGASIAILALVFGVIAFNQVSTKAAPVAQPEVDPTWINRNVLGSPDAPVVVQLWEDFLCPGCQTFATTVKPQLVEEFVKSGKVRVEYHYFPLSSHEPGATMTALAAECAADQGMFWPYHDKVFQMTRINQQGAAQFDDLVEYARGMGMNEQQFSGCLSSMTHRPVIFESLTMADNLQLPGTPSVIVGDTLVQDSTFPSIKAEIERQLAGGGQ